MRPTSGAESKQRSGNGPTRFAVSSMSHLTAPLIGVQPLMDSSLKAEKRPRRTAGEWREGENGERDIVAFASHKSQLKNH
jgi:hypothetical protein